MIKVTIPDKLYHTIRSNTPNKRNLLFAPRVIDIFDSILDTGYILTRESCQKSSIAPSMWNPDEKFIPWQKDKCVSLYCHPSKRKEFVRHYDLTPKEGVTSSEAYYCLGKTNNQLTFVLSKDTLNNNSITKDNLFRLRDEIQVVGDIPLRYVEAIALYELYTDLELIKKIDKYESQTEIIHYLEILYRRIKIVRDLLKEYDYNIPVVNFSNGEEYQENYLDEYEKTYRGL